MKKLISLYTMLFVVILSSIASAVSSSYINIVNVNESTYMIMIGVGLFLLAGISRSYKDTRE